jgi:uncharacterized protein with GYD domain
MPKYAIFFSLPGDTVARFIDNPSDRSEAVKAMTDAVGGSVLGYYWMLGKPDGLLIVEVPDSQTAAAISLAVGSTGAVSGLETHELFESSELAALAEKAKSIQATYTPPGG